MALSKEARNRLGIATTDFDIGNEIANAIDQGGGGDVASVNGKTGVVVLTAADLSLGPLSTLVPTGTPDNTAYLRGDGVWAQISGTGLVDSVNGQVGAVTLNASNVGAQDLISANNRQFIYKNDSGIVEGIPGLFIDEYSGGINQTTYIDPVNQYTNVNFSRSQLNISTDQVNSTLIGNRKEIYYNGSNDFGTSGEAFRLIDSTITINGTGDVGRISFFNNYFDVGNGTDPIDVRGIAYSYGFGSIRSGVNISQSIQGYGFQPNAEAGATFSPGSYVNAFYDNTSFNNVAIQYYTSLSLNPSIGSIENNGSMSGVSINPNVTSFSGNANFTGLGIYGQYLDFDTGGWQGISISPNIVSGASYATGISVNMGNVTAGYVRAAEFLGDVSITGDLSFGGALSIGQLQAYYAADATPSLDGNPLNMHGLVTQIRAPNGVTTINADAIGVNTAQLVLMEPNSTTTSGPLQLGFSALALPCVVESHTGSTLDYMSMAVYALSLSDTSTGGTINRVNGARVEAIPNGITTINEFVAFEFDQLFGQVGTTVWGLHLVPVWAENFIGGSLNIGSSTEKVSNSSVALEIGSKKAFLNARMTGIERDSLTAINGMQIYNTTSDKLQVYAAGAWVDLH